MRTIHKYQLPRPGSVQVIPTGGGPRPLTAQMQGDTAQIWIEVTPNGFSDVGVTVIGTGHEVPPIPWRYLATYQDGPFVWHVYVNTA